MAGDFLVGQLLPLLLDVLVSQAQLLTKHRNLLARLRFGTWLPRENWEFGRCCQLEAPKIVTELRSANIQWPLNREYEKWSITSSPSPTSKEINKRRKIDQNHRKPLGFYRMFTVKDRGLQSSPIFPIAREGVFSNFTLNPSEFPWSQWFSWIFPGFQAIFIQFSHHFPTIFPKKNADLIPVLQLVPVNLPEMIQLQAFHFQDLGKTLKNLVKNVDKNVGKPMKNLRNGGETWWNVMKWYEMTMN